MLKQLLIGVLFILGLTACQSSERSSNLEAVQAEGLIGGQVNQDMPAAVKLIGINGICSGAVVGLNPPTVITARHCVENKVDSLFDVVPDQVVFADFRDFKFDTATAQSPGDIAILIYPKKVRRKLPVEAGQVFSVAPAKLQWGMPISICGYGSSNESTLNAMASNDRRCGQSLLVTENRSFVFPEYRKAVLKSNQPDYDFGQFSEQQKVKFIHSGVQFYLNEYGGHTRYGSGRLTSEAFQLNPTRGFDAKEEYSLVNHGDSGGPWFIRGAGQNPQLFAISSMTVSAPTSDKPAIADVAWRLNNPWSKELMAKAVSLGADITGFPLLQAAP